MKEIYVAPEAMIVELDTDIITTSTEDPDVGNGGWI